VPALVEDLIAQVHATGETQQEPIRNTEENHVHD
jgi:hypothetical protein